MYILNNRIKDIRKHYNLTLEEFGKRLGVTKTAISRLEKGERNITEQMVLAICREFNVNEDWFRNGTGGPGNMLIPEDMTFLNNIGKLGNEKNEFKKFYLNTMMNLPDEFWDYLYNEFKKFSTEKGE